MIPARVITDRVTVMAKDGKTYTDIPALVEVENDMIYVIINGTDIPICRGDKISHRTPKGADEIFIVVNSSLQSGTEESPAYYKLRVSRA